MLGLPWNAPARAGWMRGAIGAVVAASWALSLPAQAALGGQVADLPRERLALRAQLQTTAQPSYTTHTLSTASGYEIRQFATPQGQIFALAWRGPGIPNMQQLLGAHFATYQSELQAHPQQRSRTALTVNHPNLVARAAGRMGSYSGMAYLPQQVPAQVRLSDLQ